MSRYTAELGEVNQLCSTQLFQNFAKAGIDPWWAKSDSAKGCAVFSRYDPWHTCSRILPDSPRYFQAALRSGLISQHHADLLGEKLLQLISQLLPRYSGYFLSELRDGRIGQLLRQAAASPDLSLQEAHQSLFSDEIFKVLPWPTLKQYFTRSQFARAGLSREAIAQVGKHPLRAITVAADAVNLLAGLKTSSETILRLLECLRDGDCQGIVVESHTDIRKVVIPCFINGFQGVAVGIFNGLPVELESFVLGELQQFAATIGERAAWAREQECLELLSDASTLSSYVHALRGLLPPVALLAVTCGRETLAFAVQQDEDSLAGYRPVDAGDLPSPAYQANDVVIETEWMGRSVQILIRPIANLEGFNAAYTKLRIKAHVTKVLTYLAPRDDLKPLQRSSLEPIRASLMQQITERRGALAACKRLYLIDFAYRHYDKGEMMMSNGKCKDFLRQTLGDTSSNGYHITGKAAARYESEIAKLMPSSFAFEQQTNHILLARWRPAEKSMS